jgi:hypothetical protein
MRTRGVLKIAKLQVQYNDFLSEMNVIGDGANVSVDRLTDLLVRLKNALKGWEAEGVDLHVEQQVRFSRLMKWLNDFIGRISEQWSQKIMNLQKEYASLSTTFGNIKVGKSFKREVLEGILNLQKNVKDTAVVVNKLCKEIDEHGLKEYMSAGLSKRACKNLSKNFGSLAVSISEKLGELKEKFNIKG